MVTYIYIYIYLLKNSTNQCLENLKDISLVRFKNNIWAADLPEITSLSSFNRVAKYFLCWTDVLTKYAWVKILKDKKAKTVPDGFVQILKKTNYKIDKLWVDQGRWFYNNPYAKMGRWEWYFNVLDS